MKQLILSKNVLAIDSRIRTDIGSIEITPFEAYGTEYGMFIPLSSSGYQFLRWIRNGAIDKLDKDTIGTKFIHISNSGEVCLGAAFTNDNSISLLPYTSDHFILANDNREITEAYSVLLRKCKTISQAVALVEKKELSGLFEPIIILPSEWVTHAIEHEYTKTFYKTYFFDEK